MRRRCPCCWRPPWTNRIFASTVIQALFELRDGRRDLALDPIQVEQAVLGGLTDYQSFVEVAGDLALGGADFALLSRAVMARQEQSLLSVAMLLGLVYDFDAMERVVAGLRSGHVPDALELLDVTLQGTELRKSVLRGLEMGDPNRSARGGEESSSSADGGQGPHAGLVGPSQSRASRRGRGSPSAASGLAGRF